MTALATERLRLRPLAPGDAELLLALQGDPEVMRYVPGGVRARAAVEAEIARSAADWRERGYGLFAVEHAEIGECIGTCGLARLEGGPDVHAPVMLAEAHWTQGLATEALGAVLRFAFETAGLERVVGVAHEANVACHRVYEKNGMAPEPSAVHFGIDCARYAIAREAFRSGG